MKIAIFTDSFLPGVGGTEKAILGLANELGKNHEVGVFCPQYNKKTADDFSFQVFRAKNIRLTKGDYYALPGLSNKYLKALKEFNPDLVHCQTVSSMARFGINYAIKNNKPIVMTIHTKFREAFGRVVKFKPVLNVMLKDIATKASKCDKVFTVSEDMGQELLSYGYKGSYQVIKNGSMFEKIENLEELAKQAEVKYNLQNKLVFIFVGLLAKFKNIQLSLQALSEFKTTNKEFVFLIVGAGPNETFFQNLVKSLELSDNVVFTGLIKDKQELSCLYARADLLLMPSLFDNDPLTIVEAATHKTPAIVIKNTGSSERLKDNFTGFMIEDDIADYSKKLVEVTSNRSLIRAVGENASLFVPKTWEQTSMEYLKYYQELLSAKQKNNIEW